MPMPAFGVAGLVPGRPLDRFGIGDRLHAYFPAAPGARRDSQIFSGLPTPVRSAETLFEMIYEAHVKPGWLLAPYFQYVFRPSGGIANPIDPTGLSADRRRGGVRPDLDAEVLRRYRIRPCRSGPAAGFPRGL